MKGAPKDSEGPGSAVTLLGPGEGREPVGPRDRADGSRRWLQLRVLREGAAWVE